ncbi:bifunctional nuclease 2 [Benincasa hispida]|uniref:bifunctional nuclease 2 n=1 Tax=Benincasa hispida TaxID=102211 RepID=UPI0019018E28|nr:bifunctional nuclease 2 [Benincasa hispida]XP_038905905.1 bifunctional nuclease 2 [Benincasa hispida]XP_038905906.1 bifunctional nuclease 2 [Benincasa hispida]
MLGLAPHFCFPTIFPGSAIAMDHPSASRPSSSLHFSVLRSRPIPVRSRRPKSILISCHSSRDRSTHSHDDDSHQDYFEASFLVSETIYHYRMWKKRFQEDATFNQRESSRVNSHSLGLGFFRRFRSPTVFLKISCNGDFLLPIVVGEYAIEKLIDCQLGIENGEAPDIFQFIQDLIVKVGYEATTARITERVVNTYFARLFLRKEGENEMLSVDARPSDALNIAYRCKIPVLVSKQIVFEDGIRVSYGFGRVHERKSCFDVLLDCAADGPDFLSEELDMLKNMKMAIYEERYKDAAMWRDKLTKLRKSVHEA